MARRHVKGSRVLGLHSSSQALPHIPDAVTRMQSVTGSATKCHAPQESLKVSLYPDTCVKGGEASTVLEMPQSWKFAPEVAPGGR